MISQTIIHMLERCNRGEEEVNIVKNDAGATMVVVFAIAEISYLVVGLFNDLVRPLLFLYL